MSTDHVIAGAVTRTIGHERGVIALVLTDADDTRTSIRGYRADGDALDMLGALQALLAATKNRATGSVTIAAAAPVVAAIEAYLTDGTITIPETLHPLTALARIHRNASAHGVSVTYAPAPVTLPADQEEAFAQFVTDEQAAHQARSRKDWQLPAEAASWVAEHDATVVYTDGSHMTTTGFGAWAWWVDEDTHGHGTMAAISSTYVERFAIFKALRALPGPVLVVTDLEGVLPDHYGRTQLGAHARLIRQLRHELGRDDVAVVTVKGHGDCPGNLAADRLAGDCLSQTWARLSTRPELVDRLVALHQDRAVRIRQLRAEALLRHQRRRAAWQARQAKAERARSQGLAVA